LHFEFCILHYTPALPAGVSRQDQQPVVLGEPRVEGIYELVAIEIRDNRRVETLWRNQVAQARASGRQLPQNLAEGLGLEFHLGDSSALSGDAQKFNVHDDGGEALSSRSAQREGG
jgi:hypothetical protein